MRTRRATEAQQRHSTNWQTTLQWRERGSERFATVRMSSALKAQSVRGTGMKKAGGTWVEEADQNCHSVEEHMNKRGQGIITFRSLFPSYFICLYIYLYFLYLYTSINLSIYLSTRLSFYLYMCLIWITNLDTSVIIISAVVIIILPGILVLPSILFISPIVTQSLLMEQSLFQRFSCHQQKLRH